MKLYDTLSREKKELKPLDDHRVTLYTCGPTIYNFAHIGNHRTFIFYDVLERALAYEGYATDRVMNITDVGHLTSDADEGEDKMDKAVARENKSVEEIIAMYTEHFLDDVKKLNIRIPEKLPRASAYIPQQLELIKILFEKGFAYDTPEAVYFDTSALPDYGKLTHQSLEDKSVGAREEVVTETSKRHPADFALWFKLVGRFEHHIQHWPSTWGEGFPGWHIECSAIIKTLLGQPIDIHAGGVDHIGTHHTNEIAQSEAAYGIPLSNFWLHGEHLLVDSKKMSKSLGNFYVLKDIEDHKIDPLAFRYLMLTSHYQTKLNFTWDAIEAAAAGLKNIYDAFLTIADATDGLPNIQSITLSARGEGHLAQFKAALSDNLNTPRALAELHGVIKSAELSPEEKHRLVLTFDEVLALNIGAQSFVTPPEVLDLLAQREEARVNKQFIQSDTLRAKIDALGYRIDDTPQGPVVRPK